MDFYTYMLRCADGTYYVGHTDDLDQRIAQHHAGTFPGYTHTRRPLELVWSDRFPDRDQAFTVERKLKGWGQEKKEALIRGDFEAIRKLARKPAFRGPTPADQPEQVVRYGSWIGSPPTQDERALRYRSSTGSAPTQDEREESGGRISGSPAIILVRPQLGENIGKAARAMLNFGLTDLRLVNPRDGWPNPAAGPAASGADVVLAGTRVFESVADAVADCSLVYATTVRKRELVLPVITPEQAAREVRETPGRSAILFGAERAGLETDEAALANKIVTVPINPAFRSLNLAQAVILFAYEWSKHEALAVPTEGAPEEPRASHGELEGLIEQLDTALTEAGYYYPPERAQASRRTTRTIMAKAGWSRREVQAVRGMIRTLVNPRRR